MRPNATDLVTFTEEILNGRLHFLCSANFSHISWVMKPLEANFNEYGSMHTASSHIFWVFRWSEISRIQFGTDTCKVMFTNTLQTSTSINIEEKINKENFSYSLLLCRTLLWLAVMYDDYTDLSQFRWTSTKVHTFEDFFLIEIDSMQDRKNTTRDRVTRRRIKKD